MQLAGVETSDCSLNFRLPLGDYRTRSKEREFPLPFDYFNDPKMHPSRSRSISFAIPFRFGEPRPEPQQWPRCFPREIIARPVFETTISLQQQRRRKKKIELDRLSGVSKDYLYHVGLKFKRFIICKND